MMCRNRIPAITRSFALVVCAALLLAACGGADDAGTATVPVATATSGQSSATPAETPQGPAPTATSAGTPTPTRLSPEELQQVRPNELGQVPILMYHLIGPEPEQFVRTPEQLRADLQWLYEQQFVVVSIADYLAGRIDIPAGKRPVILTFDDSSASQFRLLPLENGQLALDPNSAVGILEGFFAEHPDFGRGGHFGVNGYALFDWDPVADESAQTPLAGLKIQWLLDNGYEIGNHTFEHANLGEISDDEIMFQLANNDDVVHALVPGAEIDMITLPYGVYPNGGDDTLLRGFSYNGQDYRWGGALLVGANPALSPYSTAFDPYETARIQAFDDELNKWFEVFEAVPELLYVSDGSPETVTVPLELHPQLVGTLNEAALAGADVVRY